jgi:hypothetical protein
MAQPFESPLIHARTTRLCDSMGRKTLAPPRMNPLPYPPPCEGGGKGGGEVQLVFHGNEPLPPYGGVVIGPAIKVRDTSLFSPCSLPSIRCPGLGSLGTSLSLRTIIAALVSCQGGACRLLTLGVVNPPVDRICFYIFGREGHEALSQALGVGDGPYACGSRDHRRGVQARLQRCQGRAVRTGSTPRRPRGPRASPASRVSAARNR